ncbi:MAG: GBS Bsp-like repeat-containing protein, partial [Streptococcus sp.]|nr:GBS Bsp-like repeat-containing protein [Streptococcus sp.]
SIDSATTDTTDATVVANESGLSDMSDNPSANKKAEEVSEDSQTAEVVETSTTITSAVDEEATEDDNETETLTVNTDTVSEVNTASLATSLVQSTAKKVTSTQTQKSLVEASVSGNTLSIQYNGIITAGESLKFAVWSDNNDQDDLVWYDADASGAAYIDLSNHKDYGIYNIHTYSFKNGQTTGLNAMTVTVARPEVTTNITQTSNGNFTITINNVPDSITSILVPVWSDKNGQDDIKWYSATQTGIGTYQATISVANHNSNNGHYSAHIYGQSSITGGLIGLAVTSGFDNVDTRPNATVSVVNYSENKTTFDVVVTGSSATKTITSVAIAVWSEDKGQDDLIWYTPTITNNSARVTIDIANHSNTSDIYNVHVYTDYADGTRVGQVLGAYQITKPTPKNDVTATLTSDGIALTLDSNTVTDYSKVKFAVWSDDEGQDDLVWYDASSSGTALASYENHSGYGTYHIHTYSFETGKAVGLNATDIIIEKPNVQTTITKVDDNTYKVTVTNVPIYIKSVSLPVWSTVNGQDDIDWLTATKEDSSTYTGTISLKDHHYDSGDYNVHVYGHNNVTNSFVGLSGSNGIDLIFNQSLTKPTVAVQNHNSTQGTLQVVISETETSKNIGSVQVAAWSDAEQKNLHWYSSSSIVNGRVVITVDEKYHHNITGDYTVHVYIKTTDGEVIGYNLGTYAFNNTQTTSATTTTYKGTGVYGITVSGVYSNGTIKYAVWSDTNGQDDIRWYDATTVGTTATGLLNVANHSGTGTYHIHVYQSDNGKMFFLNSTSFTVKRTNYDTPYYNQRDLRWGNTHYGYYTMASTGCAPTALSMVFSALTGTTVLPTDVATYLYNETVEFNRGGEGTTGRGVLMASNKWQFSATVLSSSNSLAAVLQEGHHVVAAV